MKLLIAAGGTGGHIYPGIAIAETFAARNPDDDVLFVVDRGGFGKRLIEKEGFRARAVWARGIERKISYKAVSAPFVTAAGFFESLLILASYKPDAVVLMGGYISFPVACAAKILGIKMLLHEQNVLPGFTSRILSRLVDVVALSFDQSLKYMNGIVTGNPVRKRILGKSTEHRAQNTEHRILVMGGSQGAFSLNTAVIENLEKFAKMNIELFHIIGERDFNHLSFVISHLSFSFYHPLSYMYNIEEGLAQADLVVSRAGATAIAEFLALGVPSILVPFPYSAEGHQDLNAKALEDEGAAVVLKDAELARLPELVSKLIGDPIRLKNMSEKALSMAKSGAAKSIVELIYANTRS